MRLLTLFVLLLPAPALAHPENLTHMLSLSDHGPHEVWYALMVVTLALVLGLGLRYRDARMADTAKRSDRDSAL